MKSTQLPPTNDADIRATLAISLVESQTGTSRTLNLPRGRRITIPIPSGIPDGQVIRFEGQGEPSPGGQTGALILTINIAPLEESIEASQSNETAEKTYRPGSDKLPETPEPLSKSNIAQRFRRLVLSRPRVAAVNYFLIDSVVSDSTFSQGEIGMAASSRSNPTEVVFTKAQVWTF
ncbi:MAG TPA: DnaJ C-terminal domain-containing protein [Ktedonobacteraceae bacterium]|nr:DnaJ C-terminal domain-containing protein [Ktedonobacteraceae bacterium]